jgi:hypothetical protein
MDQTASEGWVVFTSVGRMGYCEACPQAKWERMTAASPYLYILARQNIPTRDEAEQVARHPDRRPSAAPSKDPLAWLRLWLRPKPRPVG